jgi:TIGR03009 family protein
MLAMPQSLRAAAIVGSLAALLASQALAQGIVPRNPAPNTREPAPQRAAVPAQPAQREVAPQREVPPPREKVQPGVDPRLPIAVGAPKNARAPQNPPWWPQPESHQKYVEDVLNYWEQSSAKIERFECEFVKYKYDPVYGPKPDPKTGKPVAFSISHGIIRYAKPDKGLFEVKEIDYYNPPKTPGDKPQYLPKQGEKGEHWVCSGKAVFEFNHEQKKLIEHQLPPEMQGKAIVDGPMPFLFGAEAKKIQARYWVGIFTPENVKGQYWLEAWPKFREDAQNYKKVEIIIDEEEYLPVAIQIYEHNNESTVLSFDKRKVNMDLRRLGPLDLLHLWEKSFIEPDAPFGYKKEVQKYNAADGQQTAKKPGGAQAARPFPQNPLKAR